MSLESLFFVLVVIGHLLVYSGTQHPHRFRRLIQATCLFLISLPLMFVGVFLGIGADAFWTTIARMLIYSPVFLAVLSFVFYFIKPWSGSVHDAIHH